MARGANQKLKLLYILKILEEQTDEKHPMTTKELIQKLAEYDITAERKSIYDDMNQLVQFGYDIISVSSRTGGGYYMASRDFELAELKLLVDAVQSSRFITLKKSRQLIRKIEQLTSKYEAGQLQRQVYVAGRVKTENESIYYSVDAIHKAIQDNKRICFPYLSWTLDKKLKPRREGKTYEVSPLALLWQEENYYLVAYDREAAMIKHFRVDKIGSITQREEEREGVKAFSGVDLAAYTGQMFGMYGGEEEMITLQFANRLIGVVMDRFGRSMDIRQRNEQVFTVRVKVSVSGQFFGWLAGIGKDAKIEAPARVAEAYRKYLTEIMESQQEES